MLTFVIMASLLYKIQRGFWYLFHKPSVLVDSLWCKLAFIVPDKVFLLVHFRLLMGYRLNLKNPRSFNEKLQWLKLYDHHEEYTRMVDKYEAKKLVSSIVGSKYVIPTLGVWDSVDEIDWMALPERFVVKATNDSGGVVICKDKSSFDIESAKNKLRKYGKRDYSLVSKEYPYKNVKHRFLAESYIEDESGYELKDYKFFCFNGQVKFLFVATGRQQNDTRFDFFDENFNHLPIINGHPNADRCPTEPINFEEMKAVASMLSKGIPHVRIDLYNVNGKIYFGEYTFFHWSGLVPFNPQKWDYVFGSYLDLPIQ